MESDLRENVNLPLSKAACLLLFDLLTKSYEVWRKENPDDSSANAMEIVASQRAQRVALWRLEGALERTLPELFAADYEDLLQRSEQILTGE
jgi:hypothetical protein